ncbi:MAG: Gfo/Idh/MocA family oxidoreductase [Armatimonadetes bacterium]|nr:Gfo/Idh/MocA family oxidoreductase [Armatimonadota bacterium]
MNDNTIRVGLIGCGMITQRSHAPRFAEVPGVTITALCDPDTERATKVRDEHAPEAALFADHRELLASGLVDAVTVATPVVLHCPMTLAALQAGSHVLCEKPMGMSQAETAQMVAAARAAGKVLQVNLSGRFMAFYQTLARRLAEGQIGELRHIRAIRVHPTAPDQGWSPGATWFVTRSQGGGIVGDIGVHVGDMMQWYCGEVASVSALTDSRREDMDAVDNATALFRFRNGATGILELSWTSPVNQITFEMHGSEGILYVQAPGEAIQIRHRNGETVEIPPEEFDPQGPNSFQCFADAIAGTAPTPVPGETGHAIQLVLDAILASGERGGAPVAIAPA